jgi:Flp pilus assembly secretin CpaC
MTQSLKVFSAILAVVISATAAQAQTPMPGNTDLMPPMKTETPAALPALEGETHPTLTMMPDKSELVRLDREASSVVVGNPQNIAVMLDTPRLAVVIPRASGATYFSALDKDGNVIMQRHVIVSAPKKNYVRVRRSCGTGADAADCRPTSVYFCPDMCHEVGAGLGEEPEDLN